MSKTDGTSRRHNRRQALGLAGVAAAAAAVAALGMNGGKKAQAASGWPLIIGQGNEADPGDGTVLAGNVGPTDALFEVVNAFAGGTSSLVGDGPNGATGLRGMSTAGPGVHASSESGPAVQGVSGSPRFLTEGDPGFSLGASPGVEGHSGSGPGVLGASDSGRGVEGRSQSDYGVAGHSQTGVGVDGHSPSGVGVGGSSDTSPGVKGDSLSGPGVLGQSESGHGVVGESLSGAGVQASSETGHALEVWGKAAFSTAGAGVMPAKADALGVPNKAVTLDSHITVTFTGDPGRVSVAWVERHADTGFTVHMSSRCRSAVPFTYLIVGIAAKGGP